MDGDWRKWSVLLPCEDDCGDDLSDERRCKETLKALTPFCLKNNASRVNCSFVVFSEKKILHQW